VCIELIFLANLLATGEAAAFAVTDEEDNNSRMSAASSSTAGVLSVGEEDNNSRMSAASDSTAMGDEAEDDVVENSGMFVEVAVMIISNILFFCSDIETIVADSDNDNGPAAVVGLADGMGNTADDDAAAGGTGAPRRSSKFVINTIRTGFH